MSTIFKVIKATARAHILRRPIPTNIVRQVKCLDTSIGNGKTHFTHKTFVDEYNKKETAVATVCTLEVLKVVGFVACIPLMITAMVAGAIILTYVVVCIVLGTYYCVGTLFKFVDRWF